MSGLERRLCTRSIASPLLLLYQEPIEVSAWRASLVSERQRESRKTRLTKLLVLVELANESHILIRTNDDNASLHGVDTVRLVRLAVASEPRQVVAEYLIVVCANGVSSVSGKVFRRERTSASVRSFCGPEQARVGIGLSRRARARGDGQNFDGGIDVLARLGVATDGTSCRVEVRSSLRRNVSYLYWKDREISLPSRASPLGYPR